MSQFLIGMCEMISKIDKSSAKLMKTKLEKIQINKVKK